MRCLPFRQLAFGIKSLFVAPAAHLLLYWPLMHQIVWAWACSQIVKSQPGTLLLQDSRPGWRIFGSGSSSCWDHVSWQFVLQNSPKWRRLPQHLAAGSRNQPLGPTVSIQKGKSLWCVQLETLFPLRLRLIFFSWNKPIRFVFELGTLMERGKSCWTFTWFTKQFIFFFVC